MKIFVLPDVQAKPGNDFKFLTRVGRYIAEKQPEHLVCIGDFPDMPSLSSYDKGKKSFEGRRYKKDIEASHRAMDALYEGLETNGGFKGKKEMLHGNHDDRIDRAVNNNPELEGIISLEDLRFEEYGWRTHPFLVPMVIGGVVFNHYFPSGPMDRPVTSAARLITTKHQSCIAGHQQGRQVAYGARADGKSITAIIAGSCYEHNEGYMSHLSNKHWRGILCLYEVKDGTFDEAFVSLSYLKKRYA